MKILGYTTKVVKYLVSTAESYIPNISANSIEEYAEKYSQEVIGIISESLSFFNLTDDFKAHISCRANDYAEQHYHDLLKNSCSFIFHERMEITEIFSIIQRGETMSWLKDKKLDGWITDDIKNRYSESAIQHHVELYLLKLAKMALENNISQSYQFIHLT